MWKYTFVGGSYFYCSFCHLTKDEVVLSFETQEQADACVLALSKGYTVEQWFMAVSGGKPYCVKFYVPSNNVTQIDKE
jgi:hypothetical protein